MILVTRLNGSVFALNPDLVERADCTPDTVVTLVDGTKYVIAESIVEFMDLVRHYRASLLAEAQHITPAAVAAGTDQITDGEGTGDDLGTNVVQLHRRER
jgi:flagellar protein FlbD